VAEAVTAIVWRRGCAARRLTILFVRSPFRFVSAVRLAWWFATIAIAIIRLVVAWNRLPAWFLGCGLVKATFSIATTLTALALAGADLPLRLIRLVIATPRRSLAIGREHPAIVPAIVIARIVVARLVQRFVAPPPRPVRLWPRFAITKSLSAAPYRTIGRLVFRIGRPAPLVILRLCWPGDRVEPLAHGHAGSARGILRSGARVRTETSEIPPTARFHSHVQVSRPSQPAEQEPLVDSS
jgi:hypothetical protein